MSTRAIAGRGRDFTAVYRLRTRSASGATVTVMRTGARLRVDIEREGSQSRLLLGPQGAISCQVRPGRPACLRVAAPGQRLPKPFDPGIQQLFLDGLRELVAGAGIHVSETADLPAAGNLPGADCYLVSSAARTSGVYCLSPKGILRRALFGSGELDLLTYGRPAGPNAFEPPVPVIPLRGK